jgi:hypothetical protein
MGPATTNIAIQELLNGHVADGLERVSSEQYRESASRRSRRSAGGLTWVHSESTRDREIAMRGTVVYGPRDARFEACDVPRFVHSSDTIVRVAATPLVRDLWPYRRMNPIAQPHRWGTEHERQDWT